LDFQEVLNFAVTLILVIGLCVTGIGLALWVFRILQAFNAPWEIELAAIGLMMLIFGFIAAKLFSRN